LSGRKPDLFSTLRGRYGDLEIIGSALSLIFLMIEKNRRGFVHQKKSVEGKKIVQTTWSDNVALAPIPEGRRKFVLGNGRRKRPCEKGRRNIFSKSDWGGGKESGLSRGKRMGGDFGGQAPSPGREVGGVEEIKGSYPNPQHPSDQTVRGNCLSCS